MNIAVNAFSPDHNLGRLQGMPESAGKLTGHLGGMAVEVKGAGESLADSAEELTFARDNSKRTKLAARKQRPMMNLAHRIKRLVETIQQLDYDDAALKRALDKWLTEPKTGLSQGFGQGQGGQGQEQDESEQDLVTELEATGAHPSSIFAVLLNKLQSLGVDLNEVSAALEQNSAELLGQLKPGSPEQALTRLCLDYYHGHKRELDATVNALGALLGAEANEAALPALDLSQTYSDLAVKPQEAKDILALLGQKYGADNLKAGIDALFKALGADLMLVQTSEERSLINDLASKLSQAQTINTALTMCTNFIERLNSVHSIAGQLDADFLLTKLVELSEQRFLSPQILRSSYENKLAIPDPEKAVLVGQELLHTVRDLPVALFVGLDERNKLLEAAQHSVDELIDKEDEWLATLE